MMPLFKTDEFAELCELDAQQTRNAVAKGFITPALPGSKGQVHRFSGQQALAMATVSCLAQSSRGCSARYARKILDWFEAMPDGALLCWVETEQGPKADMYDEEKHAQWFTGPEYQAIHDPEAAAMPWDGDDEKAVHEAILAAWDRVQAAIRKKMPSPDRPTDKRNPRSRTRTRDRSRSRSK